MGTPTEAEKKHLLSYRLHFHPEGKGRPESRWDKLCGFALVTLALRVSEMQHAVASPVGPVAVPTLNTEMQAFDGRFQLNGGPMPLGVDETLHALVSGIHILAMSLPTTDPRKKWCADVAEMYALFQAAGQKQAAPQTAGQA
jgi:hypothetical protein